MTLGRLRDRLAGKTSKNDKSSADDTQPQEQRHLWDVLEQWGIKINVETPPAVDVIVPLNTPTKTGPNVYFIHGIEGVASTLQAVGRKMDYPTYCFQCVDGSSLDSIESLAESYVKVNFFQCRATAKDY